MHIYHLNCGSMHPYMGAIALKDNAGLLERGFGVLHVILVDAGVPFLIDTGWGLNDLHHPTPAVRAFRALLGDPLIESETAFHQVQRLGYAPEDIQHIFITHMHIDHPGGIVDFPHATIHIFQDEYEAYQRGRIFPYVRQHSAHGPRWQIHQLAGDSWFGFDSTAPIPMGATEVRFIPLPGHSPGMCAIAFRTPDGWFLHGADSHGFRPYVDPDQARPPLGHGETLYNLLQRIPFPVISGLFSHVPRLRQLFRDHPEVDHCCSHDGGEFTAQAAHNPPPLNVTAPATD